MKKIIDLWKAICNCHRSKEESTKAVVMNFFLPKFTKSFFIRAGVVALLAYIIFGVLFMPSMIKGQSMEPTIHDKGLTLCWRGKYWFSKPQRGDIVAIRFADKTHFLKRIVALPGETVEFRGGSLYINGEKLDEPYITFDCDWEMTPRIVEPGYYYAIGDNRSMDIALHKFGQVPERRIVGTPIW